MVALCFFFLQENQSEAIVVRNTGLSQKVDSEERQKYAFTLKVFLSHWDPNLVHQAVEKSELYNMQRVIEG